MCSFTNLEIGILQMKFIKINSTVAGIYIRKENSWRNFEKALSFYNHCSSCHVFSAGSLSVGGLLCRGSADCLAAWHKTDLEDIYNHILLYSRRNMPVYTCRYTTGALQRGDSLNARKYFHNMDGGRMGSTSYDSSFLWIWLL